MILMEEGRMPCLKDETGTVLGCQILVAQNRPLSSCK